MIRIASILFSAALLTGCASAIMEKNSDKYTMIGAVAQRQGDWDAARRAYARAVVNAEMANLPAARRAALTYEYGRSLGVTCFFPEAEKELLTAYDLDKQSGGQLYLSLTELARLNYDQKKYKQAEQFYEKSLNELDKDDAAKKAPNAYADILDEYIVSLNETGQTQKAEAIRTQMSSIRAQHPRGKSITDRTPYGTKCTKRDVS